MLEAAVLAFWKFLASPDLLPPLLLLPRTLFSSSTPHSLPLRFVFVEFTVPTRFAAFILSIWYVVLVAGELWRSDCFSDSPGQFFSIAGSSSPYRLGSQDSNC